MKFIPALLAGAAAGVLSGWGVGGGTLLLLYMTLFASVEQYTAQGINLLYFLPTSLGALGFHIKNKLVVRELVVPAILAGIPASVLSSFLAAMVDTRVMKKVFGVFIILIGLSELLRKERPAGS